MWQPYLILGAGFVSVLAIVVVRGRVSGRGSIAELENWQTSLSALIGFLAVVVSLDANSRITLNEERETAWISLMRVNAEVTSIIENSDDIQAVEAKTISAMSSHNVSECMNLVGRLRLQHFSIVDVSKIDLRGVIRVSPDFADSAEIVQHDLQLANEEFSGLNASSVCSESVPDDSFNELVETLKHLFSHLQKFNTDLDKAIAAYKKD